MTTKKSQVQADLHKEWSKPKSKNIGSKPREARDYEKIKDLHNKKNEFKTNAKSTLSNAKSVNYKASIEKKTSLSRFLVDRFPKMAEKAKLRREKRNARKAAK